MMKNLVSVSQLIHDGQSRVLFLEGVCHITTTHGVMKGKLENDLYKLDVNRSEDGSLTETVLHTMTAIEHSELWHMRMGHPSYSKMDSMRTSGNNPYADYEHVGKPDKHFCEACVLSKQHVQPYPTRQANRATGLLDLVHSDVCGPVSISSLGGARYFITFIDDFLRYGWVHIIQKKSKAFHVFHEFKALVERQTGRQIKSLRIDNGGEYDSNVFHDFCTQEGIQRQFSVPYSPSQNGVAERRNKSLQEMAWAMLIQAQLPLHF